MVHPSVPANTLGEFIAHAKANQGALNYATGNTTGLVAMAQFVALSTSAEKTAGACTTGAGCPGSRSTRTGALRR